MLQVLLLTTLNSLQKEKQIFVSMHTKYWRPHPACVQLLCLGTMKTAVTVYPVRIRICLLMQEATTIKT